MSKEINTGEGTLSLRGPYLRVRKCTAADEVEFVKDGNRWVPQYKKGLIYLSDNAGEFTNFDEIIEVGPGCKKFSNSHIGKKVLLPEFENGMTYIGVSYSGEEDWIVHEDIVQNSVFD